MPSSVGYKYILSTTAQRFGKLRDRGAGRYSRHRPARRRDARTVAEELAMSTGASRLAAGIRLSAHGHPSPLLSALGEPTAVVAAVACQIGVWRPSAPRHHDRISPASAAPLLLLPRPASPLESCSPRPIHTIIMQRAVQQTRYSCSSSAAPSCAAGCSREKSPHHPTASRPIFPARLDQTRYCTVLYVLLLREAGVLLRQGAALEKESSASTSIHI